VITRPMITRPMIRYIQSTKKRDLVGCEVGVLFGANAFDILRQLPMKKLYLVDHYKDDPAYHGGGHINATQLEIQGEARMTVDPYKDRVEWLIMDAQDAAAEIKEHLDFVYLDANRKYEYVKKNLRVYYDLLYPGGWVGGPGYGPEWPGLTRAVDEFIESRDLSISTESLYHDSTHVSWWIQRPPIKDIEGHRDAFYQASEFMEVEQLVGEVEWYLESILERIGKVKLVCEIGSAYGGNLLLLSRLLEDDGVLIAIEPGDIVPFHYDQVQKLVHPIKLYWFGGLSTMVIGDVRDLLKGIGPIDALFLDAGHTYGEVANDWELYYPSVREGGAVVLHDLNDVLGGPGKLFDELRDNGYEGRKFDTDLFKANPRKYGTGVIFK